MTLFEKDDLMFVWFVIIARLVAIVVIVVILDLVVVIEVSTFIYEYTYVEQIIRW